MSPKNSKFPAVPPLVVFKQALTGTALLAASVASGQEALRNSLTQQSISQAYHAQQDTQPYNIKAGDLRMSVTPSIGLSYNDNINLTKTDPSSDWILTPMVRFGGFYPLTENNILNLGVGIGYSKYFEHDSQSGLQVDANSGVSFEFQIKDFQFDVHERFSYSQDPVMQSELAQISDFAQFHNTIGALGTWDMGDVTSSLGYDHANSITSGSTLTSRDQSSEMLVGRTGLKLHPDLTTGVEATGSFASYNKQVLNNNTSYSIGAYAEYKPGAAFRISPRVGYSEYFFQQTSQSVQTANSGSWYADLMISHRITDVISYSIDAGRSTSLGIQSDLVQSYYVRPSLNWAGIQDLSTSLFLSFESDTQGVGNLAGNLTEKYNQVATGFNLQYPIMKKLSASLNYRITIRSSNDKDRDYTQNLVSLQLAYRF